MAYEDSQSILNSRSAVVSGSVAMIPIVINVPAMEFSMILGASRGCELVYGLVVNETNILSSLIFVLNLDKNQSITNHSYFRSFVVYINHIDRQLSKGTV